MRSTPFTVAALALIAIGCGDSGRYRVSGRVTFDGQPVPTGAVTFLPLGGGDRDRSAGFCRIESGQFDSRGGRSPMEGRHRVMITGFDGNAYTSKIGDLVEDHPEGRPLFATHVVEVDIPRAQGTVLDFEVPKTAPPPVDAPKRKP